MTQNNNELKKAAQATAKSLKWVVNQIPEDICSNNYEGKMLKCIRMYCDNGAKTIDMLVEALSVNTKLKPKAFSMGVNGYKILYKCPKCGLILNMATEDWHFCPRCGQILDWGVIVEANEEFRQMFLDSMHDSKTHQELLDTLDEKNTTISEDTRYSMEQTEATKKAITKSDISYYISHGWIKEELIEKGFFKPEDFDDATL